MTIMSDVNSGVSYQYVPFKTNDLEFNGPYPDWLNVVTEFGADPTGQSDSTEAIQAAIDAVCNTYYQMGSDQNYDTWVYARAVYIPAGTYLISDTLMCGGPDVSALGLHIHGEDPEKTIIKWNGVDDGTGQMLWMRSSHDALISRLTFDGQSNADIGVRLERGPNSPTNQSYNRLEDCIFKDLKRGFANTDDIYGTGTDSEVSIMRCHFYRCSEFGITVVAADAYDYWIRNCYFEDCEVGVGQGFVVENSSFAQYYPDNPPVSYYGNYSIYDCVFNCSKSYDILNDYQSNIGIRRNVSFNSSRFLQCYFGFVSVVGNRIINPVHADCVRRITNGGAGTGLKFMDNEIRLRPGITSGPIFRDIRDAAHDTGAGGYTAGDIRRNNRVLLSGNNKFNIDVAQSSTVYDLDSRWILAQRPDHYNQDVDPSRPVPVLFTPKVTRPVYLLLQPNTWQNTVDEAAAYAIAHPEDIPVVYHMYHVYYRSDIASSLPAIVFPANVRMFFVSGGYRSNFGWPYWLTNNTSKPYFLFRGPSKITLVNVAIPLQGEGGGREGPQHLVDNCDDVNGRAILDNGFGAINTHNSNLKLLVNDHYWTTKSSTVNKIECNGSTAGQGYVLVEGGAGSSYANPVLTLGNGANFYLRDFWFETNSPNTSLITMNGNSNVQRGFFGMESCRIQDTADKGIFDNSRTGGAIIADDWHGDAIFTMNQVGSLVVKTSGSNFNCINVVGVRTAIEDGNKLSRYGQYNINIRKDIVTYSLPTFNITNGMFVVGETVNASEYGHTGVVSRVQSDQNWTFLVIYKVTGGFLSGSITGQTSGAVLNNAYRVSYGEIYSTGAAYPLVDRLDQSYHGFYWDDAAAYRSLPGYINSGEDYVTFDGSPGDAYIAKDNLHLWVWDGTQWNDHVGVVGSVSTRTKLPGYPSSYTSGVPTITTRGQKGSWRYVSQTDSFVAYGSPSNNVLYDEEQGVDASRCYADGNYAATWNQPRINDAYIAVDTMRLNVWNGSQWEEQTGSDIVKPNSYYGLFENVLEINPTENLERYKSYFKVANFKYNQNLLPQNFDSQLEKINQVKTDKYIKSNANGVTDFRMHACQGDIIFTSEVFSL